MNTAGPLAPCGCCRVRGDCVWRRRLLSLPILLWTRRQRHPWSMSDGVTAPPPAPIDRSSIRNVTHRAIETIVLCTSLIASAYLVAIAVSWPQFTWVAWLALLPLFVAVRIHHPLRAMLFGALWGVTLYYFLTGNAPAGHSMGLPALILFATVPALYAFLGAWLTRRVGFNPFVLGVGWMAVELSLAPLGLQNGLLAAAQGDGTLLQIVGGTLGYVLVAFIVALVNALLVWLLSDAKLPTSDIIRPRLAAAGIEQLFPQTFHCFPLFSIHASQPRGPPVPATVTI